MGDNLRIVGNEWIFFYFPAILELESIEKKFEDHVQFWHFTDVETGV